MSDRSEPPKKKRGRPKGSKNKPDAKSVGRPYKDGRPPQKKARFSGNPAAEEDSSAQVDPGQRGNAGPAILNDIRHFFAGARPSVPTASTFNPAVCLPTSSTIPLTRRSLSADSGDDSDDNSPDFAPLYSASLANSPPPSPQLTAFTDDGDLAISSDTSSLLNDRVLSSIPLASNSERSSIDPETHSAAIEVDEPREGVVLLSLGVEEEIPDVVSLRASKGKERAHDTGSMSVDSDVDCIRSAALFEDEDEVARPAHLHGKVHRRDAVLAALESSKPGDIEIDVSNPYASDLAAADPDPFDDIDVLLGCAELETVDDDFRPVPDDDEAEEQEGVLELGDVAGITGQPSCAAPNRQPSSTKINSAHVSPPSDRIRPFAPRSAMPTWLSGDYEVIRKRLTREMKFDQRPRCYTSGTFLDGSPFPYFAVEAKHRPLPSDLYRPVYFIWIPHTLVSRIPCPACHSAGRQGKKNGPVLLHVHGWPKAPRRVVDLEYNIYIVGHRYRCPNEECKKTYQSWSPALLQALPPALAMQFTFCLSFRGGLSDRVCTLMRSCFQRGIGPGPFSEMIRTSHYRHYDHLHVLYLEFVKSRRDSPLNFLQGRLPPFGLFEDRNGYAGFVPSATYFRTFYERWMDRYAPVLDQHMSMLSARILAIDHSFKVPKHFMQLNGVSIFNAVHSTTNDYVEVRAMLMTPTKAHDQFMPALAMIPQSLALYGHGEIETVYTDSLTDKQELEKIFPPLLRDVVPVADHSELDIFEIPESCSVLSLKSAYQVNARLNEHLQELDLPTAAALHFGFDMEWPVDIATGIQGRVALIQIASESSVLLIQLYSFLRDDGFLHLPSVHQ